MSPWRSTPFQSWRDPSVVLLSVLEPPVDNPSQNTAIGVKHQKREQLKRERKERIIDWYEIQHGRRADHDDENPDPTDLLQLNQCRHKKRKEDYRGENQKRVPVNEGHAVQEPGKDEE